MKRTRVALIGVIGLSLLALTACSGNASASSTSSSSQSITIGSANFPESELLGEMYAQALEGQGITVKRNFNIGAREVYLKAIQDGSIDLLPEYNGALYSSLVKGGAPEGVASSAAVEAALKKVLPTSLTTLTPSEAQDKDTLVVTRATAKKYSLTSIADLKPVASKLAIGAGAGWDETYVGLVGLKDKYGLDFGSFRGLDSGGPLTLAALLDGTIQVANLYSTDANIERKHLVILDDPKNLFLAENITPLIRKDKVSSTVTKALDSVSKALTTTNLTAALSEVTIDKKETATVATAFLEAHHIKH